MFYLSVSDLVLLNEWVDAFARNDKVAMKKVLWDNGLNVNLGFEEQYCTHRNLQKQVVTCVRYVGKERTDKEFLATGAASLDAHIESSGCKEMINELKQLNPRDPKDYSEEYGCNCDIPETFDDENDCV